MGARSGLSGQLGFATESVYGTYVATTKFLEFDKADFKRKKNTAQGQGLAAGRSMMHGGRRALTTRELDGSLTFDVVNRGLGQLYANAFGGTTPTPTLVAGKTLSYRTIFTFGDQFGKSLSMQLGIAPVDKASPQAFSYPGCKITEADFSCDDAGILTAAFTVDGQDVIDPTDAAAKTLAVASYPANMREFVGTDATITITPSSTGTPATLLAVRKWSTKIARGQDTTRFYYGNGPLKSEPIANAMQMITGSLNADYYVDAAGTAKSLAALFATDEPFALQIQYIGNVIETGARDMWTLNLPVCMFDDQTPTVDGPGVVTNDYPFTSYTDDAGDVPTLTIVSADAAL